VATPPGGEGDFGDGDAVDGMDHRGGGGEDACVLGDHPVAEAKNKDVTWGCVCEGDRGKVPAGGGDHGFDAGRFGPIARIGGWGFGIEAGMLAIDAAHEAEAIAADLADGCLMVIGRADPSAGEGDDGVDVITEHREFRVDRSIKNK
jgi:hypothetical protein